MKVLRGPSPKPLRIYRFTCRNARCRAELEAVETDGKPHYDQRDGNHWEFICPCCGHAIYIDMTAHVNV